MGDWQSIPDLNGPSVPVSNHKVRIDLRGKQAKRKAKRAHEGLTKAQRRALRQSQRDAVPYDRLRQIAREEF